MADQTLYKNLDRKSSTINSLKLLNNGYPVPTWIDVNTGEFCNRKCVFCPRSDPETYPNQKIWFTNTTARNLSNQLENIGFEGIVCFCGTGEPLFNPEINDIVKTLANHKTELVTNGDLLNKKNLIEIYDNGLDHMVVSLYDGPHQIEKFEKLFNSADLDPSQYSLRNRWFNEEEEYGLMLTNRAGVIKQGKAVDISKGCNYTFYSLQLDWNGDVLLCCQDWSKNFKFGNILFNDLKEIWSGEMFNKYRKVHLHSREIAPCKSCNATGTVLGNEHRNQFEKLLSK